MKYNEQTGKFFIYIAVIIVAFIVLNKIFGGLNGFLEGIGLKDSKDKLKDKASVDAANANASGSPFNPNLYKNAPGGTTIFTSATANSLAKQVYDSNGWFYDTPEQAEAAFKQANSKVKVSQICDAMNTLYKIDAFEWMKRTFDTSAQIKVLASIIDYANKLKTY